MAPQRARHLGEMVEADGRGPGRAAGSQHRLWLCRQAAVMPQLAMGLLLLAAALLLFEWACGEPFVRHRKHVYKMQF